MEISKTSKIKAHELSETELSNDNEYSRSEVQRKDLKNLGISDNLKLCKKQETNTEYTV